MINLDDGRYPPGSWGAKSYNLPQTPDEFKADIRNMPSARLKLKPMARTSFVVSDQDLREHRKWAENMEAERCTAIREHVEITAERSTFAPTGLIHCDPPPRRTDGMEMIPKAISHLLSGEMKMRIALSCIPPTDERSELSDAMSDVSTDIGRLGFSVANLRRIMAEEQK